MYILRKSLRNINSKGRVIFVILIFILIVFVSSSSVESIQENNGSKQTILSEPIQEGLIGKQEYLKSDNCSLVGRHNDNLGFIIDTEIVDDYLYVLSYTGLYLFNNSNLIYPELINQIGVLQAFQIAFKEDVIFIATSQQGLILYNISNPLDLVEIYHYYNPAVIENGLISSIVVQGDYAYYATQKEGLVIFDISNISNPAIVGHFSDRNYNRVAVSGNYAYLSIPMQNALEVINITDPTNPVNITKYNVLYPVITITIEDNLAYMAAGYGGLQILNVTDPHNLTKINVFTDGGIVQDVHIENDVAYLVDLEEGLEIVDIANLSDPVLISKFVEYGDYSGIYIDANIAYLSNYYIGVELLDISDLENPFRFQRINIGGFSYNVKVKGDIAYVCDSGQGLEIMDIKDPSNPILLSNYKATQTMIAYDMEIIGDIGFIGDIFNGIHIVDLSDPLFPRLIGNAITSVYDFAVSGDYMYVCLSSGIRIFDISDLSNPIPIGFYNIDGYVEHIFLNGNLAYISVESRGILILDLSTPSSPQEIMYWEPTGWIYSVYIENNLIYINDYNGLFIYDISDIYNPILKGSLLDTSDKSDLYRYGDYVFMSQLMDGVAIIDVSDLSNPKKVGQFKNGGIYYDFDYYNTYLYLAAFGNGLEIVTGSYFPVVTTTSHVDIPISTLAYFVPIVLIPIMLKKHKK